MVGVMIELKNIVPGITFQAASFLCPEKKTRNSFAIED